MSYRPDFGGCWAKIDRAKEHRDALKGEVGTIDGAGAVVPPSNRIGLSLEFDHQSGYHVFRAKAVLPDERLRRWGLITGDVVHNLRGALDHLVWQLARFHCRGGEPRNAEKVQFPLRDKRPPPGTPPENFARDEVLLDVAPEHRAIIEGYQPYNGGYTQGGFITYPFYWLREFSNRDKHRVIVLAHTIPYRSMIDPVEVFGGTARTVDFRDVGFGKPLELGAEILRVKVVPSTIHRNMDVAGYLTPAICFPYSGAPSAPGQQAGRHLMPVIAAIDHMSTLVVKVIREFEPLF
jgi:hypothetical protein